MQKWKNFCWNMWGMEKNASSKKTWESSFLKVISETQQKYIKFFKCVSDIKGRTSVYFIKWAIRSIWLKFEHNSESKFQHFDDGYIFWQGQRWREESWYKGSGKGIEYSSDGASSHLQHSWGKFSQLREQPIHINWSLHQKEE